MKNVQILEKNSKTAAVLIYKIYFFKVLKALSAAFLASS